MKALISYFLRYPVLGNTILLLTFVFGYQGLFSLRSTMFPEAESRIILAQVTYPGASPEEIEEGIILKIEDNLKGLTGVERISSVSNENAGTVTVEVLKGFDTQEILMEVKNAVDKIASFPPSMEPPVVFIQERLNFALSFSLSGDVDLRTLKEKAQQVETELRGVTNIPKAPSFASLNKGLSYLGLGINSMAGHGLSKVELSGFPEQEIEIAFDEDKLRAYNLSMQEVAAAIRKANVDITGGTIKTKDEELLVRGRGKEYYAYELRDIIVKSDVSGTIIQLGDVAEVRDVWSDNPNRIWFNGDPSVVVTVQNTIEEDILSINNYLYDYIEKFNNENSDIKAEIVRDGSTSLRQRIQLLTENGLLGAFLVLIVLALFLDKRLAFWVALSIPISFAGMFIIATFFDLSINVISLFGMILVVGILVDDGIVISENIFQKHEEGKKPLNAAISGTLEVFPAVVSAVLTTMTAFGAFFFLDGRLGEFAPDMAFVVISTLGFSLIEGAFILPAHVAHSKALKKGAKKSRINEYMNGRLFLLRDKIYAPLYRFCLKNWMVTIGISLFFFFVTIGAIGGGIIKTTFFPPIERNSFDVNIKMPAGTREHITKYWLDHVEQAVLAVNEEIKQERGDTVNEITSVQKKIGPSTYEGSIGVNLVDGESRTKTSFQISSMVREKAGTIYGAESATFGVAAAFGKAVSVALKGYDLDKLEAAKAALYDSLKVMALVKDITESDQPGLREVDLELKPEAKVLGLQLQDVLSQVRSGFFGNEVQRLQRGEDEVKVWVRYQEQDRSSIDKMLDMRINTPTGKTVPLRELATYKISRGVVGINHLDGMREIRIEADIADPKVSTSDINAEIEEQILPRVLASYPGVQYSFEGQSRQNAKVSGSMKKVIPVVLLIMFAIIVFTFRSFSQAIGVYLMIPFAIIGVGWGHAFHEAQISLLSGFGIIALIGIMVNDSLVFVTMVNNNLKQNKTLYQSVYEAGLSRFRPILLTSVTTIVGLGPLILNKSFQAQFLIPMAISVAYGLLLVTFTTLILLPVVLLILNRIKVYLNWLWTGHKPEPREMEAAYKEVKSYEDFENQE